MSEKFSVKTLMEKNVLTASPDISTLEAAQLMADRGTGSIVILRNENPIGIFTERDFLHNFVLKGKDPSTFKVEDVMTTDIISIQPDNSLEDAHQEMLKGNFRHLLVLENRKLVGIFSIKDLVRVREQVLEQRVQEKTRELNEAQKQLAESLDTLQREMASASKFQKYLINKRYPSTKNVRFSHVYEQAASLGGDFFEVVRIDRDHIGIFMADVMGHGITSAMIAIELKMYFDQIHPKHLHPGPVISQMNHKLIPLMPQGFFVAGFYGIVNLKTLLMRYAQFGLPKPVILKGKSFRIHSLPHGNFPLGIKESTRYISMQVKIKPGDSLLLFTDGCIEQKGPYGKQFGEKSFINTFKEFKQSDNNRIVNRLYQKVLDFAGDVPIGDDIAILLCDFLEDNGTVSK